MFLLAPAAQVATYAGEIETRKEEARKYTFFSSGNMSIMLESSGRFLSRDNNYFSYAHMSQSPSPYTFTDRERLNYDSHGFGQKILFNSNINDKDSIEFSFQGATASSEKTQT